MRTGTSLSRANLAVPLGVLGGTAILAAALVWGYRRSTRERTRLEGMEVDSDFSDLEDRELKATDDPDEVDVDLGALDVGSSSDFSPPRAAYDPVGPDDTPREWPLRATTTQSPRGAQRLAESAADMEAEAEDAAIEERLRTVRVPPDFFGVSDNPRKR